MEKTISIRKRWRFDRKGDLFLLILLIILTASQISVFIPFYSQAVTLLFTTMVLLFIDGRYFRSIPFFLLMLYFLVVFLNYLTGDNYFSNVLHVFEEIGNLLLPSAVFYYVMKTGNFKLLNALVIMFLLYVLYVTISSTIIEIVNPGIIRYTVVYAQMGEFETVDKYLRQGLSSYMFPHALPIIIPPIVMGIKNKANTKLQKNLLIIMLAVTLYMIYLSSVAMALFLAFFILVASIFVKGSTRMKSIIPLLFFGAVIFIVVSIMISNGLLHNLSEIFSDTAFGSKFEDVERTYNSGVASGDINARANKYKITTEALSGHLLLGSNKPMGEHSSFYDRLGSLGIIGIIPYVWFLVMQIKITRSYIPKECKVYYFLGMVAAFTMLALKNTSNWHTWSIFLLFMPLMIILFYNPNNQQS